MYVFYVFLILTLNQHCLRGYQIEEKCGKSTFKEVESSDKKFARIKDSGRFPFLAYLVIDVDDILLHCGGALISNRHIVSTASCAKDSGINSYAIFHISDTGEEGKGTISYQFYRVFVHPRYSFDFRSMYNDIAVVELKTKVEFTNLIWPICMPHKDEIGNDTDIIGLQGYLFSWKMGELGDINRRILSGAAAEIISNEICNQSHSDIEEYHMCTSMSDDADYCKGEIGSPISIYINNKQYLVGIVTFDHHCTQHPHANARFSYYLQWVHNVIESQAHLTKDATWDFMLKLTMTVIILEQM